ncbi:class I SAM-dependent methyltransferase [Myxosarcina sp. GI1]|uniref:class I SAM-dependent methyltransferase n=1 Tax=Myxosarcina sp. GI1 TaxID=1541065 RepID=UPI00056373A5|nr:methyltransferase domain-containing protein [Myxosarcina sp. GI1]
MSSTTNLSEQKVNQQYDKMASWYDRRWQKYIDKTLAICLQRSQVTNNEKVLDVACGTGELAKLILEQNSSQQISGIDLSANMLQVAREKCREYSNVEFQQATASKLPFDDESFDLVICASALHYFENPQLALLEIKRVLKTNGRLIILDWCRDFWTIKALNIFLKFFDSAHEKCYTQFQLHQLLAVANLTVVKADKFKLDFLWGMAIATAIKEN